MDWNNINRDRDTSGLGPIEYDQSKVPALIRKHADNVRTKTYGQEVREAQARNAELAGLIASEAVDVSKETEARQDTVEGQFDAIQQEMTDKDVISAPEIIAARGGEPTLSDRLDKEKQEVTTFKNSLTDLVINVKNPPNNLPPVNADGTNETDKIQNIVDYVKTTTGSKIIKFPNGTYKLTHLDLWGKDYSGIQLVGEENTVFEQILPTSRKLVGSYPSETFARFEKADGLITIDSRTTGSNDNQQSVKDITIKGITFKNNVDVVGFDQLSHQITAHGVYNFTVENCKFIGFLGDGVAITGGLSSEFINDYNGNIKIINNEFDGINKDNRQAVSIYYADKFIIDNNIIKNTTRENMPGAIDIEADNKVKITRNGIITRNQIKNCGGNVGAISLLIINGNTPIQRNFYIADNALTDINTPITVVGKDKPNDLENNFIKIERNNVFNSKYTFSIINVNGVILNDNIFDTVTGRYFSVVNGLNIKVLNNIFKNIQTTDGLLFDVNSRNIYIDDNQFINMGKHGVTFNGKLLKSFTGNQFSKSLESNAIPLVIPILNDSEIENVKIDDNVIDSTYLDKPTILNIMNNYVARSISTTPNKFPIGNTSYVVNGQHPNPSYTGSKAGVIEVIKHSKTLAATTTMWYYAHDAADGIYYRRALSLTEWGSWYKLTGNVLS